MANTYTLIASNTVGSGGATSIDFTSIPSTYTDLCFVWSMRQNTTDLSQYIRFNNDSGSNYSYRTLYGDGSNANSTSASSQTGIAFWSTAHSGHTASTFSNTLMYVPNYTSSNQKSVSMDFVAENNGTTAPMALTVGLWTGTAAINRVTFVPFGANFVQYSSVYMYGISNS